MSITMAQFQRKLEKWVDRWPDAVAEGAAEGAERIVAEAKKEHLSGPKMARGVGSPIHGTLLPDTGDLRINMYRRVRSMPGKVSAFIGNRMVYAGVHEYGYKRRGIPKRSFIRPSINAQLDKYIDSIHRAVMRRYRRA